MKATENATAVAFRALTEIAIIEHLARTEMARALPDALSTAGFGVLNHFVRLGLDGAAPAQLARAFQVTKAAMTYTLQRLEAADLVTIAEDAEDGRAKVVSITKKGVRACEDAIARLAPLLADLLRDVDAKALSNALPVLTQLRAALDARRG